MVPSACRHSPPAWPARPTRAGQLRGFRVVWEPGLASTERPAEAAARGCVSGQGRFVITDGAGSSGQLVSVYAVSPKAAEAVPPIPEDSCARGAEPELGARGSLGQRGRGQRSEPGWVVPALCVAVGGRRAGQPRPEAVAGRAACPCICDRCLSARHFPARLPLLPGHPAPPGPASSAPRRQRRRPVLSC